MDDRREWEGSDDVDDGIERMEGNIIEERQFETRREARRWRGGSGGEGSKHMTGLQCVVGGRSVIARKPDVKNSE